MTTNYNVSFYNFYRYFLSSLSESDKISTSGFTDLIADLNRLFVFTYQDLFRELYWSSKEDFRGSIDLSSVPVFGRTLNLEYKRVSGTRQDVVKLSRKEFPKQYRMALSIIELGEEVDEKSSFRAFEPNLIQAYDAYLCHETVVKTRVNATIHDCFSFPTSAIGEVFDYQNNYFSRHVKVRDGDKVRNWYSIFILL